MNRRLPAKLIRIFAVAILAMATMACSKQPEEQDSCGFVQNVYGQRISWKSSGPIQLKVHSSFPSEFLPALEKAMAAWNSSTGRQKFAISERNYAGPLAPKQDGVSVIYWLSDWDTQKTTEQARTSIYWTGNYLEEADMRINAKSFSYYLDRPTNYLEIHLESLLIHELGHVLGLKHSENPGSVMATYLSSNTVRNKVSSSDVTDVNCEY